MRAYKFIFAIAILISHVNPAQAGVDWTFVSNWVGKYPSTPAGASRSGLLLQPAIEESLKKILPRHEALNLPRLTSEIPVREIEGLIVVNKCRPHNCPSDMAMIVVDVNKQKLWIGFFSREELGVSTRWYGTEDDYSVLPESVKKDFLTSHGD